jgi:TPR repeat protein
MRYIFLFLIVLTSYGISYCETVYSDSLLQLAISGDEMAQLNVGICYFNGYGINQDYKEAVVWFLKASEKNNSEAQCYLGVCYSDGKGIAKNRQESFKWYKMSAENNNSNAQFVLGLNYYHGIGVIQDYEEAYFWFTLATSNGMEMEGTPIAMHFRDNTSLKLTDLQQNNIRNRAKKWLEDYYIKQSK